MAGSRPVELGRTRSIGEGRKEPCTRVTPRELDSHARHRSTSVTVRLHNRQWPAQANRLRVVVKPFFCELVFDGLVRALMACGDAARLVSAGGWWRLRGETALGLGGRTDPRVAPDRDQRWTGSGRAVCSWLDSKGGSVERSAEVVQAKIRVRVANLFAPLTGQTAKPAERSRNSERAPRERVTNLFLFLYFPTRRTDRARQTSKINTTAAGETRGVGRIAAVTPAGEGRREWGVRLVGRASHLDARS